MTSLDHLIIHNHYSYFKYFFTDIYIDYVHCNDILIIDHYNVNCIFIELFNVYIMV